MKLLLVILISAIDTTKMYLVRSIPRDNNLTPRNIDKTQYSEATKELCKTAFCLFLFIYFVI